MPTKISWVIKKTLILPQNEDIILNSLTQTREKWHSMVKKNTWMREIFVIIMTTIVKVLL